MKPKINELKSTTEPPRKKGCKHEEVLPHLTAEDAQKVMDEFFEKWNQKPVGGRAVLTNEIGQKWTNPTWLEVDEAIRELDTGHFNSFACLSRRGNNYIQCLRGLNGWHLEARISRMKSDYSQLRACRPGGSEKPRALKRTNSVSPGVFRDILEHGDVIAAFRAFHANKVLPPLIWRPIEV